MFRIPKYYDDFHGLWRSTLSTLDCLYVIKGLKRCSIDFLDEERIPLLHKFCKMNDLCFTLSDYKILSHSEKIKGGFSNACTRVSINSSEGKFAIFLSKDQEEAQFANYFYSISDNNKLGQLLGYPNCCCNFFSNYVVQASKKKMDFILYALSNTEQYDFYNNRSLRYFDISLISHFPCSLDCPTSQEIAKNRLRLLRIEYPQIAAFFEEYLKSMVIYTESQGIFFSNDYYYTDYNIVKYRNLWGTVENSLFYELKNAGEIVFNSYNNIQFNGKILDGDIGILLFK